MQFPSDRSERASCSHKMRHSSFFLTIFTIEVCLEFGKDYFCIEKTWEDHVRRYVSHVRRYSMPQKTHRHGKGGDQDS